MPPPDLSSNRYAHPERPFIGAAALASTQPLRSNWMSTDINTEARKEVTLLYVKEHTEKPWTFIAEHLASLMTFIEDCISSFFGAKNDSKSAIQPILEAERMPDSAGAITSQSLSSDKVANTARYVESISTPKKSEHYDKAKALHQSFTAYLTSRNVQDTVIDMYEKLPNNDELQKQASRYIPKPLIENTCIGESLDGLRALKASLNALSVPLGDPQIEWAINQIAENFEVIKKFASDWINHVDLDDKPQGLLGSEMNLLRGFMLHVQQCAGNTRIALR